MAVTSAEAKVRSSVNSFMPPVPLDGEPFLPPLHLNWRSPMRFPAFRSVLRESTIVWLAALIVFFRFRFWR